MWHSVAEMDVDSNIISDPDPRSVVLDLFAAYPGAAFSSSELTRAGAVFGHSPTAIRTAVARLRQEARLQAPSRGLYVAGDRKDPWRERIEQWTQIERRRSAWSGGWLMAAGRPSQVARTVWRATLRALDLEGFRQTRQGVWLRPDTLAGGVEACRERLLAYGAAASLLTGEVNRLDADTTEAVRPLWNTADIALRRQRLLERLYGSRDRLAALPLDEAAREALLVGRAAVREIVRDPLLPVEWEQAPSLQILVEAMIPYNQAGQDVWMDYLRRPR